MRKVFSLLVTAFLIIFADAVKPHYLGKFNIPGAAFLKISRFQNKTDSLFMTTFFINPFKKGQVFEIPDIGKAIVDMSIKPKLVGQLWWPNDADVVPRHVFGGENIWVADGFLVPGKSTGGVYIVTKNSDGTYRNAIQISTPKSGYFYHFVKFVDMNGDGKVDVLTARANKPLWGKEDGELLWLEHPKDGWEKPWKEHVLMKGPDVLFEIINDNSLLQVFACEFFAKKLSLTTIRLGNTPSVVSKRVLDEAIGSAYGIEILNLNKNGKKHLVVTNHEGKGENGGVFAYEIPLDLQNGNFTKHILTKGFPINGRGFNEATPGFVYGFDPKKDGITHLLVAGDGSHEAYCLEPTGSQYNYTRHILRNVGGTQGSIAHGDVDKDGFEELFIPNYDSGDVFVYRMK